MLQHVTHVSLWKMVKTPNQLIADHKNPANSASIYIPSMKEPSFVISQLCRCLRQHHQHLSNKACEMLLALAPEIFLEHGRRKQLEVSPKHGGWEDVFVDRFTHGFLFRNPKRVDLMSFRFQRGLHSKFGQKHCGFEVFGMECPFF